MTRSTPRLGRWAACLAAILLPAAARADETVLIYDRYTQVANHRGPNQPAQVDTSSAQILVILGDRRLVVREPNLEYVYDFDQRRVRIVDGSTLTFADWSLFGLVAFSDLELTNRLGTGGRAAGGASVRELEALFSMPAGVKPSPKESLVDSSRGNSVDVLINGRPFTHAILSETVLPADQVDTFERFLLYNFHLHPAARRAIVRTGRVPDMLFFRTLDLNQETIVSWHLVKATTTPEVNDPTRGLPRMDITDKDFSALASRLKRCREFSADTSRARRTSQSLAFEESAMQQGHYFDAALARLARELESCQRVSFSAWPAELREKVAADSSFRLCLEAADALDARHAKQLVPRLGRIGRQSLMMGHVVDLLAGRARIVSGDPDAVPQVMRGLTGTPLAIQVWMDLGQAYYRTYQPVLAWLCFDAAREAAPAGCAELEPSARIEADLLKRRPEFLQ